MILSTVEPILLADSAPIKIPMIEIKIVAVVNSKIVLGSFSKIISFTSDEPTSLVRKVACPKSNKIILYIVNPILCGEYHGSSKPKVLIRSSVLS